RFNPEVDRKTGYRTRTILCLPMRDKAGGVLGVFQVLNKREGAFGKDDEELLGAVASQAAIALENARLYDDLKKAYERVKQLDQMKSDFLANISHELRTPLTPVIGYVDMMTNEALGPITEHQRKGLGCGTWWRTCWPSSARSSGSSRCGPRPSRWAASWRRWPRPRRRRLRERT
ncbi:MAG: GAF domain-containing protein, partial [candidate division NC10 bacterium]|nr:GAF domain-containing protein [candidate division NC10 bacterium]